MTNTKKVLSTLDLEKKFCCPLCEEIINIGGIGNTITINCVCGYTVTITVPED